MKPPRRPTPSPAPPEPDGDLDFATLMAREGVTPTTATRTRKPRTAAPPPTPRPTATQKPITPPTTPPTPHAATPPQPPLARQLTALRHELASVRDELSARTTALLRERDAALLTSTKLRDELTSLRATTTALQTELTTRTAELTALQTELTTRTAELTTRTAELTRTRAALLAAQQPPPRHTLAAALTTRGLEPHEHAAALALLTTSESAAPLLDQLETRDPTALAALLTRRLALVCGDPGCAPELGALALAVARPRCEVCGGSDIQRAAHGFVRACQTAGITRVRFVGGSPNYRTKLEALFPAGGPLHVRITAGDKHVRLHRARSQQDDLVIVWGATELDHATSGAYRGEHGRTEIVAHRGIGRMLELAALRISP